MRKMKKFSKGGKTSRADTMRDRRMADIESDYQKALRKGKSEKEAQAKRDQRIADAKDDYAKRTGADRTETRAAEKAAEARLTASRRSPDKDVKSVSVASTPSAMTKVDTTAKADTPNFSAAKPKPAARQDSKPKPVARQDSKPKPAAAAPAKEKPKRDLMAGYRNAAARQAAESPDTKKRISQLLSGPITDPRKVVARETANAAQAKANTEARRRIMALGQRPAKFKEPVSTRYAKGGKIDGAAIRGKTKLKRSK